MATLLADIPPPRDFCAFISKEMDLPRGWLEGRRRRGRPGPCSAPGRAPAPLPEARPQDGALPAEGDGESFRKQTLCVLPRIMCFF